MEKEDNKKENLLVRLWKRRPRPGWFSGAMVGFLAGILFIYVLQLTGLEPFKRLEKAKEDFDDVITEHFFTYTAQDLEDAVLGEATKHKELVVMEQEIEQSSTITKAGLANLEIFSKTKTVTYYGKGAYTVDFGKITSDKVVYDEQNKVLGIIVPHAKLQYLELDLDKTVFEDTEKGLLAFGDLALTMEQQSEIEKNIEEKMREKLTSTEAYKKADEFAAVKLFEVFQPVISKIAPDCRVIISFGY